ncbi:MAG: hypothetical protein GF330_14730 [Candidatus Eisenbacteria bacterium]|nr:hypothetical protein [Candidatus Eisenbacteria bacterium]
MTGSSPTFENCLFEGNLGTMAGGVMVQDSEPRFLGCRFQGNTSGAGGGAICAVDGSAVTCIDCIFSGNEGDTGGAVMLETSQGQLTDCVLFGNHSFLRGGAIHASAAAQLLLSGCTVVENSAPAGGGMVAVDNAHAEIARTIIAFSIMGGSVRCLNDATVAISCSDVHGNMGGDWYGCLYGLEGVDGNFDADPLFCGDGPLLGPYTLDSDSPCAEENQPACGRIGALPVRCGAAAIPGQTSRLPGAELALRSTNPATAGATLHYAVPSADPTAALRISVHAADGRCVKTLHAAPAGRAEGNLAWDGRDARGWRCAAGVYYVYLQCADERLARALVLAR